MSIRTWRRDLMRECEAMGIEGVTINSTGGDHLRIQLPNGAFVFAPSTPSDQRVIRHVRSQIRKCLREIPS